MLSGQPWMENMVLKIWVHCHPTPRDDIRVLLGRRKGKEIGTRQLAGFNIVTGASYVLILF